MATVTSCCHLKEKRGRYISQFGFKGQLCQKHFLQLPAPLTAHCYWKKINIISVSLSFHNFSSYGHKVSSQSLLLTISSLISMDFMVVIKYNGLRGEGWTHSTVWGQIKSLDSCQKISWPSSPLTLYRQKREREEKVEGTLHLWGGGKESLGVEGSRQCPLVLLEEVRLREGKALGSERVKC
jgi:hypothetical protein